MELREKCKECFVEWFYVNDGIKNSMAQFSGLNLYAFCQLPFSMRYGIYLDFFEDHELFATKTHKGYGQNGQTFHIEVKDFCSEGEYSAMSTQEDYKRLEIDMLTELFNDRKL